jgi:hypothetical protein
METAAIQPRIEAQKPIPADTHEVRHCKGCGAPMFMKPVIQCGHCGRILQVRCFSYGKAGVFYAECIDLNLLSRGNTQEEAIIRLQEQMFSYVATALAGDTEGLIPRRASLLSFIRYYLSVIKDRFSGRSHPYHKVGELQIPGASTLSHC